MGANSSTSRPSRPSRQSGQSHEDSGTPMVNIAKSVSAKKVYDPPQIYVQKTEYGFTFVDPRTASPTELRVCLVMGAGFWVISLLTVRVSKLLTYEYDRRYTNDVDRANVVAFYETCSQLAGKDTRDAKLEEQFIVQLSALKPKS